MIDVLVPVLGRPQNAQPLADSFRAHAPDGATVTFICTATDREQINAAFSTRAWVTIISGPPGPGDYARKTNAGFNYTITTRNLYVLNGSDDITFTAGWWQNAMRVMDEGFDVVATNDRANASVKRGKFGTHCLIRRSYIDEIGGTFDGEPGVVLYEGYDHNYVDRELCAAAQWYGRYAYAKDSVITHRHPLWRTAEWDDTYRKGHAKIREDHALFEERLRAFTQTPAVI